MGCECKKREHWQGDCEECRKKRTGNKSASVGGLYDIHIDEMIEILRDLAVEKLPNWHSGCNAYCTKEMKEYEIKIDKLFEKIGI